MKKRFCTIMAALLTCAPALADIPSRPWQTNPPDEGAVSWINGQVPILIIAVVLIIASIVLWFAIRNHKTK